MANNNILNNAKYNSENTDEWYTTYDTVHEELSHYKKHFKNKVVLCNCDDPFESAFSKYFLKMFNVLQLKKLICTSYESSKYVGTELNIKDDKNKKLNKRNAYVLEVDHIDGEPGSEIDDDAIKELLLHGKVVKRLNGNGDFSSSECVKYLEESDIVCTNPPFSKFEELFVLIMKNKKKFLLIGNQNAITYKEIFPYIKNNKVWIGYRFGEMKFKVPSDTKPRNTRYWQDKSGQKWRSLGNAMWLTNLDIKKRHLNLELKEKYNPETYKKYDNYDAINVKKVSEIPNDYDGIMGVPITFLKYHNKAQFEIIGEANHGSDNKYDLFKPIIDGKEMFKKILIRRKQS